MQFRHGFKVKSDMIGPRHDLKVRGYIVRLVTINVVHDLVAIKQAPKRGFSDKAVLLNVTMSRRIWMIWRI